MDKYCIRAISVTMVIFMSIETPQQQANASKVSGVSYALCNNFTPQGAVHFKIIVQPKNEPGESIKPSMSATFDASETKGQASLAGFIDPELGFDFVQVQSSSMQLLCLQALVVDLTIFIDGETKFETSIVSNIESESCARGSHKKLGCKLSPVFACPAAIKALLVKKNIINKNARARKALESGKPPVYDITQDMVDAAFAITDGATEIAHNVLEKRKQSGLKISQSFNSFKSFLKKIGPALNSLGGVSSILTTFLTPNPFDELANFMKNQFDIVQNQIRELKSDINNLERVVESQSNKLAMTAALRSIRFHMRGYQKMVASLSKAQVCKKEDLLEQSEVKLFIEETQFLQVRNYLEDLLDVDFGGVLEASTGLLLPIMRAYCNDDPGRVERFMKHVELYAYGGTQAIFAFFDLFCAKNGKSSCPDIENEKIAWLKKLYRFTKKAVVYTQAVQNTENRVKGLGIDIEDDLNKLKMNTEASLLFDEIKRYILHKLNDKQDWPYVCILRPHLDAGKMFIFGFAQIDSRIYGTTFKPWALFHRGNVQRSSYKPIMPENGYTKKNYKTDMSEIWRLVERNDDEKAFLKYSSSQKGYVMRPWQLANVPPTSVSGDRMMYFMFNPMNHHQNTGTMKVVAHIVPIDVYFIKKKALKEMSIQRNPVIGCWRASKSSNPKTGWSFEYQCEAPDPENPNKREPEKERYAAIIGE